MKRVITIYIIFTILFISGCINNLTEYWDNGNIKSELEYLDDSQENYFYREYYKSGIIKIQAQYKNKKLHGDLVSYKKNGEIKSIVKYKFGSKNNPESIEVKTGSIKVKVHSNKAEILNKAEIIINTIRI